MNDFNRIKENIYSYQLEGPHEYYTSFTSSDRFKNLERLGLINSEDTRSGNIGSSDYSKHIIQPWAIWQDYNLNPWDADIVKRVLRTKKEPGMSENEARILDYLKIIHICNERIRQLNVQ